MSMAAGRQGAVLVGITGGMGSGKSTVSRFWAAHAGLPRVDIDEVCRQLLEQGEPGWQALRSLLPAPFFSGKGGLDRRRLRAALFADGDLRREVNRRIHPLAQDQLRVLAGKITGMVLVDVPLLYEAGWQDRFAACVVVYAERAACCRRLVARDDITPAEAAQSMAAQLELTEKALLAQHVIDNSGCWLFTRLQVAHLARLLRNTENPGSSLQESP